MVANVMSATLLALNLFSRTGVLFTVGDVNMAWKSALCFKIVAANSSVAAALADSVMVNFVALGKDDLDAMLAKVSSIALTTGLFLALSFLELMTFRIDVGVAARVMGPDLGLDLVAEQEQDLEQGQAASTLIAASSSLVMVVQKILEQHL